MKLMDLFGVPFVVNRCRHTHTHIHRVDRQQVGDLEEVSEIGVGEWQQHTVVFLIHKNANAQNLERGNVNLGTQIKIFI